MSAEIVAELSAHTCATNASMGPRSDERGNTDLFSNQEIMDMLQWGRAQMSAEIPLYP